MPLKNLSSISLLFFLFNILFCCNALLFNTANANEMESHATKAKLPIMYRLAFMTGHVEAGIELYKLKQLKMAAPHLMHPISEIHIEERKGLDKLGLKGNIFEQVSNSLENNIPALQIESLLNEASINLSDLANKVGGDSKKIIIFLLETTIEEYELSLKKNKIVNIGEYQDAWGFVKVAMHHAKKISDTKHSTDIQNKLKILHGYWSNGPLPIDNPTEPNTIKKIIKDIISKL